MTQHNPIAREALGRLVREVWTAWALEQPAPKPSWLTPWEQLSESDREVDRRIGEAVHEIGLACGRHRGPEGPNEDLAACLYCGAATWAMRAAGETYGDHLPDCSLPSRHESFCRSDSRIQAASTDLEFGVALPNGEVKVYGDQDWVRSGAAITDAHPDGRVVQRAVVVTHGPWEARA